MAKNSKFYSIGIGLWKTFKNSAWMGIPILLAMLATIPVEYAWIAGPVGYFLKNLYENKLKTGAEVKLL